MRLQSFRPAGDPPKRAIALLLLAAAALLGTAAHAATLPTPPPDPSARNPAETASALRILPRRVVRIRVSGCRTAPYTLHFDYDAQGRTVAIRKREEHESPTEPADRTTRIAYAPDRLTATTDCSATVHTLTDGRTAAIESSWNETPEFSSRSTETFTYDREGYLAGHICSNEQIEYEDTYTIVDGVFTGWTRHIEGQRLDTEHENDPARLNNLNLDLFGLDEFSFYGDYPRVWRYGTGGRRVRILPVRITHRWLEAPDRVEYRTFRYALEGDYIARIEIDNERGEQLLLEFFYAE